MKCFGEKPRNQLCKIVLLDETELLQEIQETCRGQDLLDVVFKHLNLLETAYFGLRYVDNSNQTHWLDPTKKAIKQLKAASSFTLYFGVKFYASEPCKLLEEITRYQFFLQVKQDILQGRLPVAFDLAAELFALSVQSELGDYDPRRHHPGYVSEFSFVSNQASELESKAAELHKGLVGQVPSTAELNFLERVKWLDMYGVDLHPVLGEDNIEYFLGLTPSGVIVLRNKVKVGNYFWPRITKVYFKGKYFMLRVRDKNNDENTYGFELPSKQACKHLWKCCVEHHAFFRLTQVREVPGQPSKVFSLGSRFRYSGRTEKQIQMDLKHQSRSPPAVIRVPSRRYQKRLGQPDGADAGTQDAEENYRGDNGQIEINVSVPKPVCLPSLYRSSSIPSALPVTDSPKSTRSAPWEDPKQRGLFSTSNPSPGSVHGSSFNHSSNHLSHHRRTSSMESDSSWDCRRRRHHRSKRNSDNDSDISKSSKGSRASKSSRTGSGHHRRHKSHSRDSGSDSDLNQKRRSRRHKTSSNYELVDSEEQWQEIQKQKQEKSYSKPQNAVVRDLTSRKSGYMNSGIETESEATFHHRRKHRRHSRSRSRSPEAKKALPDEVKKHIEYKLVDPSRLSQEERRNIKFTNVETENNLFKIRYSPSSGKPRYRISRLPSKTSLNPDISKGSNEEDGPPPPYSLMPGVPINQEESPNSQWSPDPVAITTPLTQHLPSSLTSSSSSNNNKNITTRNMTSLSPDLLLPSTSINERLPLTLSSRTSQVKPGCPLNGSAIRIENTNLCGAADKKIGNNTRLPNGSLYSGNQAETCDTPKSSLPLNLLPFPKGLVSQNPWTQKCPGSVTDLSNAKSVDTLRSQSSHEMSTEL